jgi:hypothetical protein
MSRAYRSKTEPLHNNEKEGLRISWALVPINLTEQESGDQSKSEIKFPKIKINMN